MYHGSYFFSYHFFNKTIQSFSVLKFCFVLFCFFNTLFILFIYLFMTVLGLLVFVCGLSLVAASGGHSSSRCGGRSSSRCAGPFTIAAPPATGHRLQTRRLSSRGSRAQPLRGMWDPPRPGPEPASPALAGRFSATAPPGKPEVLFYFLIFCFKDISLCSILFPFEIAVMLKHCYLLL